MSFLGAEAAKAPAGMRTRRFITFLIDAAVIVAISFLLYKFVGHPDFFAVRDAMDAMEAAGGQDAALTEAFISAFNKAYGLIILIALCYEIVLQLITNGSTVGKLLMGLRIVSINPARGRPPSISAFVRQERRQDRFALPFSGDSVYYLLPDDLHKRRVPDGVRYGGQMQDRSPREKAMKMNERSIDMKVIIRAP